MKPNVKITVTATGREQFTELLGAAEALASTIYSSVGRKRFLELYISALKEKGHYAMKIAEPGFSLHRPDSALEFQNVTFVTPPLEEARCQLKLGDYTYWIVLSR